MNASDYFKKLEGDPEYLEAERKHKLILDIADEILRLRIEKGWSQAELAERAGTKQANISRLENGMLNPSVNFLEKIAKAFGADIFINFMKTPTTQIYTGVDTENKAQEAYLVANWPKSEMYDKFEYSSDRSS